MASPAAGGMVDAPIHLSRPYLHIGGDMRARTVIAFAVAVIVAGPAMAPTFADGGVGIFERGTKEITLPVGTRLPVVLDTGVASNTSHVEQAVTGHTSSDVMLNGAVAVPAGSQLFGVVTDAT